MNLYVYCALLYLSCFVVRTWMALCHFVDHLLTSEEQPNINLPLDEVTVMRLAVSHMKPVCMSAVCAHPSFNVDTV